MVDWQSVTWTAFAILAMFFIDLTWKLSLWINCLQIIQIVVPNNFLQIVLTGNSFAELANCYSGYFFFSKFLSRTYVFQIVVVDIFFFKSGKLQCVPEKSALKNSITVGPKSALVSEVSEKNRDKTWQSGGGCRRVTAAQMWWSYCWLSSFVSIFLNNLL